jgi:hypothetical protein
MLCSQPRGLRLSTAPRQLTRPSYNQPLGRIPKLHQHPDVSTAAASGALPADGADQPSSSNSGSTTPPAAAKPKTIWGKIKYFFVGEYYHLSSSLITCRPP